MSLGNFNVGAEVCDTFTTVNTSGVPTQLLGTCGSVALAVFKGASSIVSGTGSSIVLTQDLTTTTGAKLNGLNHWRVVTAGCSFFTCGNYSVVISCGTVGGSAVWGTKIAAFSLQTQAIDLTCTTLDVIRTLAGSATITCDTMGAIGVSVLAANLADTPGGGRNVGNALRPLRNLWGICGTIYTVAKEDDSTTAWTSVLSTTAGTTPVTGSDPA